MPEIPGRTQATLLWGTGDAAADFDEAALPHHPVGARRVEADPENVERGLVQLVLTVVELLRELMERQALRRVQGGSLTDAEIERLGDTFRRLNERMDELKAHFGLTDEDLNIH